MHKCLQTAAQGANAAMPLYRVPGPCPEQENHLHEGTVDLNVHERKQAANIMSWKQEMLEMFEVFGPASLAVLSFTEAIIQPLPPDILYLPMLVNAMGDTPLVVWLWGVVTVASVLGSLVGYLIGQRWGTPLMVRFGQEHQLKKLEHLTENYGSIGIFIAAFSPIPYKVLGWMAGMGHMEKKSFLIAGFLGRGLRFGLEALLIGIYGNQALQAMEWFIANEILLAIATIACAAMAWMSWRWWNSIGDGSTA